MDSACLLHSGSPEGVERPSGGSAQHVQSTYVWADSLLLRARSEYFRAALTFIESQVGEAAVYDASNWDGLQHLELS
eukprot:scaffold208399_cov17-Tisochrysis_lutea.AAC.1